MNDKQYYQQALPGVADEQPHPKGHGSDVAQLVHADLNNLEFLLEQPSHGNPVYRRLLACALMLRPDLPGCENNVVANLHLDLEARIESGKAKYGERLTSHNGRNAKLDLYQEILDAIAYARQDIFETEGR